MEVAESTLNTAQSMSARDKGILYVVAMVTANGADEPYQSIVPLEQIGRETVIHQTGPAFFNGERLSTFGDRFVQKIAVLRVAPAVMDSSKHECIRSALDLWRQGAHALAFRRLEKAAQYAWGHTRPEWWT